MAKRYIVRSKLHNYISYRNSYYNIYINEDGESLQAAGHDYDMLDRCSVHSTMNEYTTTEEIHM